MLHVTFGLAGVNVELMFLCSSSVFCFLFTVWEFNIVGGNEPLKNSTENPATAAACGLQDLLIKTLGQ